jgi:hypothetical protein
VTTETESPLTAERVDEVFRGCLFTKDDYEEIGGKENAADIAVIAEGITFKVGFHPKRLEGHTEEIIEMLDELPDTFKASSNEGGWSFLNACYDRHGRQWTGLHRTMEELFLLGIAIGRVEYLAPREMWPMFHGGMPYLVIKDA